MGPGVPGQIGNGCGVCFTPNDGGCGARHDGRRPAFQTIITCVGINKIGLVVEVARAPGEMIDRFRIKGIFPVDKKRIYKIHSYVGLACNPVDFPVRHNGINGGQLGPAAHKGIFSLI